MMNWVAQGLGLVAMASLLIGYQQTKREKLLACKLTADVFWTAHYLVLGGYAGAIPNFIGISRELIFINRDRKKWANRIFWPILFILIGWIMAALSFKSAWDILPILASSAVTLSLWFRNPTLTKIITIPVCASFLIYNITIGSYVGILNESLSIISLLISLIREGAKERKMKKQVFSPDFISNKEPKIYPRQRVTKFDKIIEADLKLNDEPKAKKFAEEIARRRFADFENRDTDKMCHVSTFTVVNGTVYMSYYASTEGSEEKPDHQKARLAYCPLNNPENMAILDILSIGDKVGEKTAVGVYDTVLMKKNDDDRYLYVLWTANLDGKYYRLYRTFDTETETLGEVKVNRFKVGGTVNDYSSSGMQNALKENGIGYKEFFSDIGIMQKLSTRVENGQTYYYSGTYSGNFTCIIKSTDLITWEYVAQPNEGANGTGFDNETKWENAVYVLGDTVYYFVRQWDPEYNEDKTLKSGSHYGILTAYSLTTNEWATPVLVGDCQSRGDFIYYQNNLYLWYAPSDREHIGILKIDTGNIKNSEVVLQADMKSSCFYPFVQYFKDGELAMSYTVSRRHIRLAEFTLSDYL